MIGFEKHAMHGFIFYYYSFYMRVKLQNFTRISLKGFLHQNAHRPMPIFYYYYYFIFYIFVFSCFPCSRSDSRTVYFKMSRVWPIPYHLPNFYFYQCVIDLRVDCRSCVFYAEQTVSNTYLILALANSE